MTQYVFSRRALITLEDRDDAELVHASVCYADSSSAACAYTVQEAVAAVAVHQVRSEGVLRELGREFSRYVDDERDYLRARLSYDSRTGWSTPTARTLG